MYTKSKTALTLLLFSTVAPLFAVVLTGCKQQVVVNPDKENEIEFDSITVNEVYYLLGDTANPHCTLQASFIYPSGYRDQETLQKICNQFIHAFFGDDDTLRRTPQNAMNKYVQKYLADYADIEKDFVADTENTTEEERALRDSWYSYYETSSNEILYNKCNLLSYSVNINYYTGGAHGGHGYNNYVVDLLTGDQLHEADIFTDNYQDALAQIIVETLLANNNISDPTELETIGFFNAKEIYPNNNFYVDATGIGYTYNEYEIAAYSVGKVDILLPYDKIRHLIRKDSPVARLAAKK